MDQHVFTPDNDEEEKRLRELYDKMLVGDSRCPIAIGARIEKINAEEGDMTYNGHKGYVRGNIYLDDYDMSAYLVEWDKMLPSAQDNPFIFVIEGRIKQI